MFRVWSVTYDNELFDGTKQECREFIKVEKQAQIDLDLPKETYIIERT